MSNQILQNLVSIQSGYQSINEKCLKNKIKLKLYTHQLETVQRMLDIENNKDNNLHCGFGILADPVGSGKTLEMLSLIAVSPAVELPKSIHINGSNKRIVVSDRIIYEVDVPYTHNTDFIFKINKNNLQGCHIYGTNNYLRSISYNYNNHLFKHVAKTPYNWSYTLIKTNIIVVPHNVIGHWRMTLTKFTKLKHLIISRTADIPEHINHLDGIDVVIVSSPRLKDMIDKYLQNMYDDNVHYYIYRFIVDEAHTYKGRFNYRWKDEGLNFGGNFKFNSIYIWWISSSFASLFAYNSPVNILTPLTMMYNDNGTDLISKVTVKHSQDDISNSIQLPPKYHYKIYSELSVMWQAVISNFKNILTTEALAAINANDYGEAIQRLGIDEISPENLLDAMTQKLQDEIDNMKILLNAKAQMKYKSENYKKNALTKFKDDITEKENKLEQIVYSLQNGDDCPICYCELDEIKALLQCCYKKACLECLVTYFTEKYECPSCGQSSPKYVAINKNVSNSQKNNNNKSKNDSSKNNDNNNENETLNNETRKELSNWIFPKKKTTANKHLNILNDQTCTKEDHFDALCQLLICFQEKPSILVFSSYDGTFGVCKNILKKYSMDCKEIKGTPEQINKMVDRYNKQELSCLMLNSKYMGFGMNLQQTTDIIIMHKMETEMENQVVGRAYRIGKKTPLRVWYIYHKTEENT
jgi:SNF2 family DNA or RNA helicase